MRVQLSTSEASGLLFAIWAALLGGCASPGAPTANIVVPIRLSPADAITLETRQQIENANRFLELVAGHYAELQRPLPVP